MNRSLLDECQQRMKVSPAAPYRLFRTSQVAARRQGCYNGAMSSAVTQVQIRTFVAIELPAPVLEALAGVQQGLARLPVRLAGPAGLHLTLAFIGEIPAARVPEVVAAVQQGCGG